MAYADRDFHPVDKLPLWAHKVFAVGDRVLEIRGNSVATLTNTDITITASAGGASKSAVVHVVRPPEGPR
jgi:hypothetical protein